MTFGISKAISQEHNAMREAEVLVMKLTDVPMTGVPAALAIENAIQDASSKGLAIS